MKTRLIAPLLRRRLKYSPAVALLGARQCGKTTLARGIGGHYFDAEQPGDRVRLDLEWEDLIKARKLIVIDEAQTWPDLFPRLRAAIDARRKQCGRFLLLGSVSPLLMREVSESLAGRLARIELTPFLATEVKAAQQRRLWLMGGFPDGGIQRPRDFPRWQGDYIALMTQRDLPAWGFPARPQVTQRLLQMLAATHGQIWNASALGKSLGLSYHTVNGYLDFLEGTYLVRRLAPWSANLRKRLVKSPKIYFRDSGVLHGLLGAESMVTLLRHPAVGASWEGFVIEQLLGAIGARGWDAQPHFFRTSDGHEADLVLQMGARRVAVEIKLTAEANPHDLGRLNHAADLIDAEIRLLVCQTTKPVIAGNRGIVNLAEALRMLVGLIPK